MTMRKLLLPALITSVGLLACSGSDGDDDDGMNPSGPPAPRNVSPIPGGGTSGGPIQDVLTVFLLDEDDMPIQGGTILVLHKGEELKLESDAEGRVDFWKESGLDSSLSVHAFADGYRFSSFYGGNASVLTINLDDGRPNDTTPAVGTVTGTITGWDLLPANTMTSARVAQVGAVGEDLADVDQPPRPGTVTPTSPNGSPYNLAINGEAPFPMWSDYSLETDVAAERVFTSAGIFDTGTGEVTFSHVGVSGPVTVTDGETTMVDVEISHPLDQMVEVSAPNLTALDTQRALFGLRFGEKGPLLPLAFPALMGGSASANGPALTGNFSDALYLAGIQATSDEMVGDEPAKTVFALRTSDMTSFTFDALLTPPDPATATGRSISTNAVNGATVQLFEIIDSDERSHWEVVILGDAIPTVELPAVPAGLTDPLTGTRIIQAAALDLGDTDVNNAAFEDLEQSVVSQAGSRVEVSF